MTKIADLTLKGSSKTEYTFKVYPIGTSFKKLGGVYYISKRTESDGKGSHTQKYIGITEDLSSRFDNHHKADCFKKNGANCISVHLCESEDERQEIEKDLLSNYDCPCNEMLN
jgi:hypothetical protein